MLIFKQRYFWDFCWLFWHQAELELQSEKKIEKEQNKEEQEGNCNPFSSEILWKMRWHRTEAGVQGIQ